MRLPLYKRDPGALWWLALFLAITAFGVLSSDAQSYCQYGFDRKCFAVWFCGAAIAVLIILVAVIPTEEPFDAW